MRIKPDSYYEEMNLRFELQVRLKEQLDDSKDASYLKQLHRTRSLLAGMILPVFRIHHIF